MKPPERLEADSINVDSDEGGFYMVIGVNEEYTLCIRIQDVAEQLYDQCKARIGPWLRERDEAQSAYRRARREEGLRLSEHGYDISDPKHPDFHSVHADIWDAREGK